MRSPKSSPVSTRGGDGGNAGGPGQSGDKVRAANLPTAGKAGNGGMATAIANSTSNAGNTLASAIATGGSGGKLNGKITGKAGGADAKATATAPGLAVAVSSANGGNGSAGSLSISTNLFRNVRSVQAKITDPLPILPGGGRAGAMGRAEANVGGSAPALTPNNTHRAWPWASASAIRSILMCSPRSPASPS
jgi:hypothetical protein